MNTLTKSKSIAALSAVIMAAAAFAALIPASEADAEDPAYDTDLGQKWSMRIQFVFSGKDAQSIEWDFGDGTEHSTEWNPLHEYAKTGVYYGKQTVTNPLGTDEMTFRIEVMGYPTVAFDSNGGTAVETIKCTSFGQIVSAPKAPTKEGAEFAGWYADKGLTQAVDWSQGVKKAVTYYAKWTGETPAEPEGHSVQILAADGSVIAAYTVGDGSKLSEAQVAKDLAKDGKVFSGIYTDKDLKDKYDFSSAVTADLTLYAGYTDVAHPSDASDWAVIGLFFAGIAAIIAFAFVRHPACIIAGIAMIAVAALIHMGVFSW
ncbi:MAG: InlB B-repeat-containing protein [Candidatus Methanomethylophilus sp.]|jgi:uncharacterized repeat protein (TIGR02543 family)|nr:InlB B-repeat-containing protein [Methanomethylophilus sp.]MCI2075483.1 InlB B-repeat-containing protein [Methanomethylophilus sp.]MCI2093305.1 InlB B-repeat-containing protein [Methanomethylophilus sp.]